jgi:hypothetical protein
MPSKYDAETSEIGFVLKMTTNILLLFFLILYIFSIIFPQGMLILTVIFVVTMGAFILSTKTKIKNWKAKFKQR